MSKHTPAPWLLSHDSPTFVYALEDYEHGNERNRFELSVQNGNCQTPRSELEANARLIAATPELLEACKIAKEALLADCPMPIFDDVKHYALPGPLVGKVLDLLRNVIAKAEKL